MNHRSSVAPFTAARPARAVAESLPLPLNIPRDYWPALIEHAAAVIAGRVTIQDRARLDRELQAIAGALRGGAR